MFTKSLEFTVVKFHRTTTAPDFDFDHIARDQHLAGHLHVVTGQRGNDEEDKHESMQSPRVEHDLI